MKSCRIMQVFCSNTNKYQNVRFDSCTLQFEWVYRAIREKYVLFIFWGGATFGIFQLHFYTMHYAMRNFRQRLNFVRFMYSSLFLNLTTFWICYYSENILCKNTKNTWFLIIRQCITFRPKSELQRIFTVLICTTSSDYNITLYVPKCRWRIVH